jgi:shikimate kinase
MAEDLRNFLVNQNTTFILIKRTIINYKKLPKTSVTLPKTRTRLSDLKKLWKKAQHLYSSITLATMAKDKKNSTLPRMLTMKLLTTFRRR